MTIKEEEQLSLYISDVIYSCILYNLNTKQNQICTACAFQI